MGDRYVDRFANGGEATMQWIVYDPGQADDGARAYGPFGEKALAQEYANALYDMDGDGLATVVELVDTSNG